MHMRGLTARILIMKNKIGKWRPPELADVQKLITQKGSCWFDESYNSNFSNKLPDLGVDPSVGAIPDGNASKNFGSSRGIPIANVKSSGRREWPVRRTFHRGSLQCSLTWK
jgi:hypothetical protein